jgi:WD40 repeat protein
VVSCDIRTKSACVTIIPTVSSGKLPDCWTLRCSPSSHTVVAGYSDGSVCLFDLRSSSISFARGKATAGVCSLDFCDQNRILASTIDGSLVVFNSSASPALPALHTQAKAHGDNGTVWAVRSLNLDDNSLCLSSGSKGDVKLWDLRSRGGSFSMVPLSTLLVSSHAVVTLDTFTSDSHLAVLSSLDKRVGVVGLEPR